MAVSALSRTRARSRLVATALPPVVLVLTLIAPALDLLAMVQPAAGAGECRIVWDPTPEFVVQARQGGHERWPIARGHPQSRELDQIDDQRICARIARLHAAQPQIGWRLSMITVAAMKYGSR